MTTINPPKISDPKTTEMRDNNGSLNQQKKSDSKEKIDIATFRGSIRFFTKFKDDLLAGNFLKIQNPLIEHLEKLVGERVISDRYNVIFLLQEGRQEITTFTLDEVYESLSSKNKDKELLLILNSKGGYVEPAYLISKCCQEHSTKFSVAIPRRAKSAATLISLGADSVHMGSISELGPIDPQIKGLPALALGAAVEYLAKISEEYPGSSEMLARFLSRELDLQILGHTQRIAKSAIDYATRLLGDKGLPIPSKQIGKKLVDYKDHSFVIDKDEARLLLGDMVKFRTEEYELANKIYQFLEQCKLAMWVVTKEFYEFSLTGDAKNLHFSKQKES